MLRNAIFLLLASALLSACGANGAPKPPEGYQPHPDRPFVLDPLVASPEGEKPQR